MRDEISVKIPRPLARCFGAFETECVTACCGIGAFEAEVESVAAWARGIPTKQLTTVASQLDEFLAIVEDRSRVVVSADLNHVTVDDDARRQLLDFLEVFREGLAAAGGA